MLDVCRLKFLLTTLCKLHQEHEVIAVLRLPPTCCFTLFKEYLNSNTKKFSALICTKLRLRGGPSFGRSANGKFFNTERGRVDPAGNVLLLLRGEQGQVLRGQAHPSSAKWKDVGDVLRLLWVSFPFRSPANAHIIVAH